MVKTVLSRIGTATALVVMGWISFGLGSLSFSEPLSILFLAIARVLP